MLNFFIARLGARCGGMRRRCGRAIDQRLAGIEQAALVGPRRQRGRGQHRGHDVGHRHRAVQLHASLSLASFAPAPSAISLASAISRCIGAMPQLVVATMLLFGTNFETLSMTSATSSAVSTVSLATSMTPA